MVGLPLLVAVAAPALTRTSPLALGLAHQFAAPSGAHPMGTDQLGRDEFSRVVYGARVTIGVALVAVGVAVLLGTAIGLVSGYFGGVVDSALMRLMDAVMAFPAILLAIAIVSSLGPGILQATAAIGIVSIPGFARVGRAEALRIRSMPYVEAAHAVGAGHVRILTRYVLPNALSPVVALTATSCAGVVLTVASLSFVGLGAQPPTPDWGGMLETGYPYLTRAWWLSVFPGAAIAVLTMGFIFLGDGLRDILDPHRRS